MAGLIRRFPLALAAAVCAGFLSACAVPLGPGYQLRRQTLVARYAPPSPGVLQVQVDATVRNTGTEPLDSLEIRVPGLLPTGGSFSVEVGGRPVNLVPASGAGGRRDLVPFIPPLALRQARRLHFGYAIPLTEPSFVLDSGDWFVSGVPPRGAFAFGDRRADRVRLALTVPADYRAFSPGKNLGVRRLAGQEEYRYELQRDDFDPFLLVGKYQEQKIPVDHRQVLFWTLEPLDSACASSVASHLAATFDLYRSLYGRIWSNPPPISVIQVSGPLELPVAAGAARARSVSGGVLVGLGAQEICGSQERFFELADRALAATWFDWAVRPEPDARAVLGIGAVDYAALAAGSGNAGPQARARMVAELLKEYTDLSASTNSVAPARLGDHATAAERRLAGIQAALGFVALEDQHGQQPVRRALAHLVAALRGSTAGLDDFRSALEQETGENLYAFFQEWFERPGIPAGFQDRYRATRSERETGSN